MKREGKRAGRKTLCLTKELFVGRKISKKVKHEHRALPGLLLGDD